MPRQSIVALVSICSAVLLLAACAISSPITGTDAVPPSPPDAGRDIKPSIGGGSTLSSDQAKGPPGVPATGVARAAGGEAASPADGAGTGLDQRMIVYNTTINLSVDSVPETLNSVTALADGLGGTVISSSSRFQGEKQYAALTIKVPASAYNQAMTSLRRMGVKVLDENGTTRDVTEEFTDLEAQLRNYQATEAQLLELMKRANTIDEILKVQAQLTSIRGQIERTKGRMQLLQRTSDMATIAVNLSPSEAAKQGPKEGWDPGVTVREAWEQSLRVVQNVADIGLRVVVFSWWLVPPALALWALWAALRRPARRSADTPVS